MSIVSYVIKQKRTVRKNKAVKPSKAIKLSKLWNRLSLAQRKRLAAIGFDSFSWDNNVKEVVVVQDHELIHVGSATPIRCFKSLPFNRKSLNDIDATLKAIYNI